jgi:Pregnancy-associated plasma protein-A/Secretion system C-terminal sorting domain
LRTNRKINYKILKQEKYKVSEMKKNYYLFTILFLSFININSQTNSITLDVNTNLIIADGSSTATLEVHFFDINNDEIFNIPYELIDNGISSANNLSYVTTEFVTHNIYIQAEGIQSNTITINARENINYDEISVPVIFHIINFGENIGSGVNLTQSQVNTILGKLNNNFSNFNNSANPNAVDIKVSFLFAVIDENGTQLPELGINRIDATSYDNGSPQFPSSVDIANDQKLGPNEGWSLGGDTFWNPREYLNIWIYPTQTGSSTATLPRMYQSFPLDGLSTVPDDCQCDAYDEFFPNLNINTNSAISPNSSSVSHEVGHALGLLHVFSSNNCSSSDFCPDTYSYVFQNPNSPCSDNLGTTVNDNIMDYLGTKNVFTYDQRERIRYVFEHGLWYNELKDSNTALSVNNNRITENFKIYPNPTNTDLNIDINYLSNFNYSLYNPLGQEILNGNFSKLRNVINVSNMVSGIYFLKICENSTKSIITQKILIK